MKIPSLPNGKIQLPASAMAIGGCFNLEPERKIGGK